MAEELYTAMALPTRRRGDHVDRPVTASVGSYLDKDTGARGLLFKALSRHFIKVCPSKGLFKMQTAPACSALFSSRVFEPDVIKMMGVPIFWATNRLCSSRPPIPGKLTSEITHDV